MHPGLEGCVNGSERCDHLFTRRVRVVRVWSGVVVT